MNRKSAPAQIQLTTRYIHTDIAAAMKDESKKISGRSCLTCGTAHAGRFGSGIFCSSSRSCVEGAKARGHQHRRDTSALPQGTADADVVVLCEPDAAGALGLLGERVVVRP